MAHLDDLKRRFSDLESEKVSKIDNSSKIGLMAKVDKIEYSKNYSYTPFQFSFWTL